MNFTEEQLRRAEQGAIRMLRDLPAATPTLALAALTLCLFAVVQQSSHPRFTPKEQNDLGVLILTQYQLSADFPYTIEQIQQDILEKKLIDRVKDSL